MSIDPTIAGPADPDADVTAPDPIRVMLAALCPTCAADYDPARQVTDVPEGDPSRERENETLLWYLRHHETHE